MPISLGVVFGEKVDRLCLLAVRIIRRAFAIGVVEVGGETRKQAGAWRVLNQVGELRGEVRDGTRRRVVAAGCVCRSRQPTSVALRIPVANLFELCLRRTVKTFSRLTLKGMLLLTYEVVGGKPGAK